jgi:hypothetical protein
MPESSFLNVMPIPASSSSSSSAPSLSGSRTGECGALYLNKSDGEKTSRGASSACFTSKEARKSWVERKCGGVARCLCSEHAEG